MADNLGADPVAFFKGMWEGMGIPLPGMVTPTLDVNELDKRIKEMKAVEGWLKMNLSMLQASIQGLEVQRATLAALSSLSKGGVGATDTEQGTNPLAAMAMWPFLFGQGAAGVSDSGATK